MLSELSTFQARATRTKLTLLFGALLVAVVVVVAILGPGWAPHNPMEQHFTLLVNGRVKSPPYPPWSIPGYPLGTDQFGRDLLSRLLWAIRPTLLMVTVVAFVRLAAGVSIGLLAGASEGLLARWLEALISLALSVPVLLAALLGITAVGVDRGLPAFIFGLAITGWAETARLVAEQTRLVRRQAYIEAAVALGSSRSRLLFTHILRQVLPLVWMSFAFEISSTLFVVAELGFLGYYIGGGIWVEVSDFVAVNTTGLPELGQMLSSALVKLTDPSAMVVTGSVMLLIVLGFNLLGEGLRQQSDPRRSFRLAGKRGVVHVETFYDRMAAWFERYSLHAGLAGLLGVLALSGVYLWNARDQAQPPTVVEPLPPPGNHLWASQGHDARGTRWTPQHGPRLPRLAWFASIQGGFSGDPAVAADGTLYLATREGDAGALAAYSLQGELLWRSALPAPGVGAPGLGAQGEIYVADAQGGLSRYSPSGLQLWRFEEARGRGAVSGPVFASNGNLYYLRVDGVQAVSPTGEGLWLASYGQEYLETPPVLSPQESFLFVKSRGFAAQTGAPLDLSGLPLEESQFSNPALFVGADNRTYFRGANQVMRWRSTESGIQVGEAIGWEVARGSTPIFPSDQGVTPSGVVWLFYSWDYMDAELVSFRADGKILANVRMPLRQAQMIAIDASSVAYVCASNYGYAGACQAVHLESGAVLWELPLGQSAELSGGALVEGRLYLATPSGYLICLEGEPIR